MRKRKTAEKGSYSVRASTGALQVIVLAVALAAAIVLVVTGVAPVEATGLVIAVLGAVGWQSRPRQ